MAGKGAHARDMSPLQALILDRMRAKGWTPKDVEERGVSHATLHRYSNPLVMRQPPRKSVLQQLATALDLDLDKVERAAVESVGYSYTTRAVPPNPPSGEELTQQIIALIRIHPDLQPVTKAHLSKQVEILTYVPRDSPLTPHEAEITPEEADERDLGTLQDLSDRRRKVDIKSPRPPRRAR